MPKYVWIYDNRQRSRYVSNNTYREVTIKVNEYLLRDSGQEPVNDHWKIIIGFNYFIKKTKS